MTLVVSATDYAAALGRIAQLEAELTEAKLQRDTWKRIAESGLGMEPEPQVSTLCAICDQIKELHPASHPWTAKETKADA